MSVVTEEMVEIATLAAINKRRAAIKVPPLVSLVGLQIPGGSNALEIDAMRAALAAVAPLIAAQERERCAALVDCGCAHRADVLTVRNENSGERWRACGNSPCGALEARAIRALGDAT